MREARRGCCYGLHAEMDAIRRLPPKTHKRQILVDLVVVRVSKNGSLKNSAPCYKCIEHLNRLNKKTNYKVRHIYYSDQTGNIVKKKFVDLLNATDKHMSWRFRSLTEK